VRLPGRVPPAEDAEPVELGPMLAEPRRALWWSALLLGAAAVIFLMVWNTTTMELVQSVDDAWLDLMEALRWQPFVTVAEVLSFIGGTYCTWAIRITVIVILIVRKNWLSLSAFLLAVAISEAFIGPVKALYERPRPPNPLIGVSMASFPSGHAVAASVTAVGLVIVLLPPGHKRWVWERRAVLYASLMALSRTYLSAHWFSDVVAGALLGGGIALACPALLVDLRVRVRARTRGDEALSE
jgi:membrane-associated phospholipid phosphatase